MAQLLELISCGYCIPARSFKYHIQFDSLEHFENHSVSESSASVQKSMRPHCTKSGCARHFIIHTTIFGERIHVRWENKVCLTFHDGISEIIYLFLLCPDVSYFNFDTNTWMWLTVVANVFWIQISGEVCLYCIDSNTITQRFNTKTKQVHIMIDVTFYFFQFCAQSRRLIIFEHILEHLEQVFAACKVELRAN